MKSMALMVTKGPLGLSRKDLQSCKQRDVLCTFSLRCFHGGKKGFSAFLLRI